MALEPDFRDGKLTSIGLRTGPAYVQETGTILQVDGAAYHVQFVFSGVFFVLIDASENGLELRPEKLPQFIEFGPRILAEANRLREIRHPERPDIKGFALALFYERRDRHHFKDIVVGRTGSVDRSPCGAGSGALAALQFAKGELTAHEGIDVESVIGTHFDAQIVQRVAVGPFAGGIPRISGSAYVTGFHQFVLEARDPLKNGFLIG
jgi:proline racemase